MECLLSKLEQTGDNFYVLLGYTLFQIFIQVIEIKIFKNANIVQKWITFQDCMQHTRPKTKKNSTPQKNPLIKMQVLS